MSGRFWRPPRPRELRRLHLVASPGGRAACGITPTVEASTESPEATTCKACARAFAARKIADRVASTGSVTPAGELLPVSDEGES